MPMICDKQVEKITLYIGYHILGVIHFLKKKKIKFKETQERNKVFCFNLWTQVLKRGIYPRHPFRFGP